MKGYLCIAMLEDPPYNIFLDATDLEPEQWLEKLPLPCHLLCHAAFRDAEAVKNNVLVKLQRDGIEIIESKNYFSAPPFKVLKAFMMVRDVAIRELMSRPKDILQENSKELSGAKDDANVSDAGFDELIAWADINDISEEYFPRDKQALLAMTKLDLREHKLAESFKNPQGEAEFMDALSDVTSLIFSGSQLSSGELQNLLLGSTNYGGPLTSLPESIGDLTNLTELNLEGRQLTVLPESIGKLTNLTVLDLDYNELAYLPDSIGNLKRLTILHLKNNALTKLPGSISDLTNLTVLKLGSNQLTSIPKSIGKLINLTVLELTSNRLTNIPESIGHLINLIELNFGINDLTTLPDSIGDLVNLTEFSACSNKLTKLPESIGKLNNLNKLYLFINQLTTLPESICNLANLTVLDLGGCICDLERYGSGDKFTSGYIGNQLTELPESISELTNLTKLNLSYNRLTELPESISKLINLTELNLNNNPIKSLPQQLIHLRDIAKF